jgi:hypothetical protein
MSDGRLVPLMVSRVEVRVQGSGGIRRWWLRGGAVGTSDSGAASATGDERAGLKGVELVGVEEAEGSGGVTRGVAVGSHEEEDRLRVTMVVGKKKLRSHTIGDFF